jgi:hydrogenase expression/formation protein HypE
MREKNKPAESRILLHHGSGGEQMQKLIREVFLRNFRNPVLGSLTDSAILDTKPGLLAFTTDSYVVDPVFFPGGDIGKLAVCGTINDLAVSGARPVCLSASFIIEEGFLLRDLETIVRSMASEAKKAMVQVVTGDTKVVNKGKCDRIFITTSGIGILEKRHRSISFGSGIRPGDRILVNGTIGDHGMAILNARESFRFSSRLVSDCTSLNRFLQVILNCSGGIRFMRDATRGGLATVLCEVAAKTGFGIRIRESGVPLRPEVRGMSEILGMDPLYMANEGKVVMVVSGKETGRVLEKMKREKEGRKAAVIGEVVKSHPGKVVLDTVSGGRRFLEMLSGDPLPRIC